MSIRIGEAQRANSNSTSRYLLPAFCGLIFILGCLLHYQRGYFSNAQYYLHNAGADDAYISYRYGWNLARSGILAWNESGFRRTEGFTNPLWVFLSAAWSLIGNKDLVYPAMTITSVILTAAILIFLAFRIQANNSTNTSLIGIFLLSANPILWSHTTSGLESGIFGALIGLAAYISIFDNVKSARYLAGLIIITTFLRSDGFIYILILLIALLAAKIKSWKQVSLGLISGTILLFGWRILTFGKFLPNTAVAKLNFPVYERILPGIQYFLASLPAIIPLIVIGLLALRYAPREQQIAAGLVLSGWSAYYIYIGGDTYLERHIIGFMFLLAGTASLQSNRTDTDKKQGFIRIGLYLALMYVPLVMIGDARFDYLKVKPPDPWILLGKEIEKDRDRYGVIVIGPAGKIPFFAGGDFVDELGLNDPYLSTLKRDQFIPGHGAGSRKSAVEIANAKNHNFSFFAFGNELDLNNVNQVWLWIDDVTSTGGVHHSLTNTDAPKIIASNPNYYSLIYQGISP